MGHETYEPPAWAARAFTRKLRFFFRAENTAKNVDALAATHPLQWWSLENHDSGPVISDVVLASFAIKNRAVLHTNDPDFSRFPALNWRNPLAAHL